MNVKQYIKNVGKSFGYAVLDQVHYTSPAIKGMLDQSAKASTQVYQTVKEWKNGGISSKTDDLLQSTPAVVAKDYISNLLEDVKTGKFYNKEREEKVGEEMAAKMFGLDATEMDDVGNFDTDSMLADTFNLDDDNEPGEFDDLEDSIDDTGERVANAVNEVTVRSANYIAETQKYGISKILDQLKNNNGQVLSGINAVNTNLLKLDQIGQNLNTHIQNSTNFFTKTNEWQEKVLTSLTNIEKSVVIPDKQESNIGYDSNRRRKLSDMLDMNGVLDLNEVVGNIKANLNESLSMFTAMGDMFGGSTEDALKMLTASPLKGLMNGAIKLITPIAVTTAAREFDRGIRGFFGSIFGKINSIDRYGGGVKGFLANLLGTDNGLKTTVDTSNYEKGKVSFDGVTRKSIIEVIPTYLSKILSAVSGSTETRYDYENGEFTSVERLNKRRDSILNYEADDAGEDIRDAFREYTNGMEDQKKMLDELNTFFRKSVETGQIFNYRKSPESQFMDFGISDDTGKMLVDVLKNLEKQGKASTIMNYNTNVQQAREDITQRYGYMSSDSTNPLTSLFNGSMDNSIFNSSASPLNLNNMLDDKRHNIFFYMQGIYQFTKHVSDNIENIGGGRGSSGSNRSNFKAIEDIPAVVDLSQYETDDEDNSPMSSWDYDLFINGLDPKNAKVKILTYQEYMELESNERNSYMSKIQQAKQEQRSNRKNQGVLKIPKFMQGTKVGDALTKVTDNVNRLFAGPANAFASVMTKASDNMLNIIYGKDDGDIPDDEREAKESGILNYTLFKIKQSFTKLDTWVFDNIINPIKDKISGNGEGNGLFATLFGLDRDTLKEEFKTIKDDIKTELFGNKNENGDWEGGILSNVRNNVKKDFTSVKNWMGNSFSNVFPGVKNYIEKNKAEHRASEQGKSMQYMIDNMNQAYTGKKVSKSGMVAVSEGELIIPSELNPFYHGITNKARQDAIEKDAIKRFYGRFAEGTTSVGGDGTGETQDQEMSAEDIAQAADNLAAQEEARKGRIVHRSVEAIRRARAVGKESGAEGYFTESLVKAGSAIERFTTELFGDDEQLKDIGEKLNTLNKTAMKEMAVPDNISGLLTGGALGMGASLLTGGVISPMMGAALGSATGFAMKSKAVQDALFGDEEHEGLLSDDMANFIKKRLPNIAQYSFVGTAASMIPGVPGGPLAGLVLGSVVGLIKSNESVKEALFGKGKKDGLIKQKYLDYMKKNITSMGAGAILGGGAKLLGVTKAMSSMLNMPFINSYGIMGTAIIGAGLGLFSTTEQFHQLIFGDGKKKAGLVGWMRKRLVRPFFDFTKPVLREVRKIGRSVGRAFTNVAKKLIIGGVKKAGETKLGKAAKFVGRLGLAGVKGTANVATLPITALGAFGRNLERRQLRKATSGMSAQEALSEMERLGMTRGMQALRHPGSFNTRKAYQNIADMSVNNRSALEEAYNLTKDMQRSDIDLRRENVDIGNDVMSMMLERGIDTKTANKIRKRLKTGDMRSIDRILNNADTFNVMSDVDRNGLRDDIYGKVQSINTNRDRLENRDAYLSDAANQLSQLLGIKVTTRAGSISNIQDLLRNTLKEADKDKEETVNGAIPLNEQGISPEARRLDEIRILLRASLGLKPDDALDRARLGSIRDRANEEESSITNPQDDIQGNAMLHMMGDEDEEEYTPSDNSAAQAASAVVDNATTNNEINTAFEEASSENFGTIFRDAVADMRDSITGALSNLSTDLGLDEDTLHLGSYGEDEDIPIEEEEEVEHTSLLDRLNNVRNRNRRQVHHDNRTVNESNRFGRRRRRRRLANMRQEERETVREAMNEDDIGSGSGIGRRFRGAGAEDAIADAVETTSEDSALTSSLADTTESTTKHTAKEAFNSIKNTAKNIFSSNNSSSSNSSNVPLSGIALGASQSSSSSSGVLVSGNHQYTTTSTGETIKQVVTKQGELVPDLSDDETKQAINRQNAIVNAQIETPRVLSRIADGLGLVASNGVGGGNGSSSSGGSGILGGLLSGLLGNGFGGILSNIIKKGITLAIPAIAWKGVFSFLTDKGDKSNGQHTSVSDKIADKGMKAITGGTGVDSAEYQYYGQTHLTYATDDDGNEIPLQTDTDGNVLTDDNGNYLAEDGSTVSSDSIIHYRGEDSSASHRARLGLAKDTARNAGWAAGKVNSALSHVKGFDALKSFRKGGENYIAFKNPKEFGSKTIQWTNKFVTKHTKVGKAAAKVYNKSADIIKNSANFKDAFKGFKSAIAENTKVGKAISKTADAVKNSKAVKAISDSNAAQIMSDALEGVANQIKQIPDMIKSLINKTEWMGRFTEGIRSGLNKFLSWFTKSDSAATKLYDKIASLAEKSQKKIVDTLSKTPKALDKVCEVVNVLQAVNGVIEGLTTPQVLLGIEGDVSVPQRIFLAIAKAIWDIIPLIGIMIDFEALIDLLLNWLPDDLGFGSLKDIKKKRSDLAKKVEDYNAEHGTKYNSRTYLEQVEGMQSTTKQLANRATEAKKNIDKKGIKNYVKQMNKNSDKKIKENKKKLKDLIKTSEKVQNDSKTSKKMKEMNKKNVAKAKTQTAAQNNVDWATEHGLSSAGILPGLDTLGHDFGTAWNVSSIEDLSEIFNYNGENESSDDLTNGIRYAMSIPGKAAASALLLAKLGVSKALGKGSGIARRRYVGGSSGTAESNVSNAIDIATTDTVAGGVTNLLINVKKILQKAIVNIPKALEKFSFTAKYASGVKDVLQSLQSLFMSKIQSMSPQMASKVWHNAGKSLKIVGVTALITSAEYGYNHAGDILQVVDELSESDRIFGAIASVITSAIPFAGLFLDASDVLEFLVSNLEKIGISIGGMKSLRKRQKKSKKILKEYNSANGTNYSIEDYNREVLNRRSVPERAAKDIDTSVSDVKRKGLIKSISDWGNNFYDKSVRGDEEGAIRSIPVVGNSMGDIGHLFYNMDTSDINDILDYNGEDRSDKDGAIERGIRNVTLMPFKAVRSAYKAITGKGSGIAKKYKGGASNITNAYSNNSELIDTLPDQYDEIFTEATDGDHKLSDIWKERANYSELKSNKFGDIYQSGTLLAKIPATMVWLLSNMTTKLNEALTSVKTGVLALSENTLPGSTNGSNTSSSNKSSSNKSNSSSSSGVKGVAKKIVNAAKSVGSKVMKLFGGGSGSFISQYDPSIAGESYGSSNVAEEGCGPAAAAMAVNDALGKNSVDIQDAMSYSRNNGYETSGGTTADYFQSMFQSKGLSSNFRDGGDTSSIYNDIASGKPTVLLGRDANNNDKANSPFGPGSHYVVADGMDANGNIQVKDPEQGGIATYSSDILNNVQASISAMPQGAGSRAAHLANRQRIKALKGKGSSKRNARRFIGGGVRGGSLEEKAYNFFIDNGFSACAAAGAVGNLMEESGYDHIDLKAKETSGPAEGVGMVQWSYDRRKAFLKFCDSVGQPFPNDNIEIQLQYCLKELTGDGVDNQWMCDPSWGNSYKISYEEFKACNDIDKATEYWCANFERPNVSEAHMDQRKLNAHNVYNQYSGNDPIPYDGTITSSSDSSDSSNKNTSDDITTNFNKLLRKKYGSSLYSLVTGEDDEDDSTSSSSDSNTDNSSSSSNNNPTPSKGASSAVNEIQKYIGNKYVFSGNDPNNGIDCSGLTKYVLTKSGIKDVPRTAATQFDSDAVGTKVEGIENCQAGDLVFFRDSSGRIHHVAMMINNNEMVHAQSTKTGIVKTNLRDSKHYTSEFAGIRRPNYPTGSGSGLIPFPLQSSGIIKGKGSGLTYNNALVGGKSKTNDEKILNELKVISAFVMSSATSLTSINTNTMDIKTIAKLLSDYLKKKMSSKNNTKKEESTTKKDANKKANDTKEKKKSTTKKKGKGSNMNTSSSISSSVSLNDEATRQMIVYLDKLASGD